MSIFILTFLLILDTAPLNINRLHHLLTLFGVTKEDLLERLNSQRKTLLTESDIFTDEIRLSLLKKIDAIFQKGLSYYIDPKEPVQSKEESIFFRKDHFNASLNLGARQIVNRFEEEKIAFSTLAKLSDFKMRRLIPEYNISNKPLEAASAARKKLFPEFNPDKREFLKNLITKFADNNILVFEFVEAPNKKEKANINGFYLSPNVIVLKRNQKSFSREIFTLAHELGHYLLNVEEIDDNVSGENEDIDKLSKIERWCNDFAFHFLAGDYAAIIETLSIANSSNDYHHSIINEVSQYTHLSKTALYTRLLLNKKISPYHYRKVTDEILAGIKVWEENEKKKAEQERLKALEEGRILIATQPKPIVSPLYLNTLRSALYNNLINEADFCKKLHINPEKIEKYL